MDFSNDYAAIAVSWTELRTFLDGTVASAAYTWDDEGGFYRVISDRVGGFQREASILKDGGADQLDFEANFRDVPAKTSEPTVTVGGLVPVKYDYIEMNYTGKDLTQMQYKLGGPTGTVVATVDYTYDLNKNVKSMKRT